MHLCGHECDKCRSSSVANMWTLVQVRLRCQKGIPPALRGRTWLYLSGGKVKKEQNQARFQVSQVSLSLLLSFFLPYFFGFWVPVHFQLSFYTTLGCLLTQNADVLNSAPDRTFSNDTHDSRMSFVCSARSWIISQGIPNGWMSSRKTCIDSFLFMKCSCHEEDTGRRLLCRALDFNAKCWPLFCWVSVLQAAGLVPGSKGLHTVQTRGGILPGSGPHRCCAAHAHACRGTPEWDMRQSLRVLEKNICNLV